MKQEGSSICFVLANEWGHAMTLLVEALLYRQEGHAFYPRWYQ
jgi:hypothetical protein